MKRSVAVLMAGLFVMIYPLVSMAAVSYQGKATSAVVFVDRQGDTDDQGGSSGDSMSRHHSYADDHLKARRLSFTNLSGTPNVSVTFSNVSGVSGIGSTGKVVFNDSGFWTGFNGTGVAAPANIFMGNIGSNGVIRLDGDVTYDLDTDTYLGSGQVVEFSGSVDISGMLPGGVQQTLAHALKTRGRHKIKRAGIVKVSSTAVGTIGMLKVMFNPTTAAIITVTDGVPDRTELRPVFLEISIPGVQIN